MSSYYNVPTANNSLSSVTSSVLAVGVALLFVYLVHFSVQFIVTFVIERDDKERNRIKQKLLQTARVLYLYIIAAMISIYPPFYYGPHCGIMSWITLIIVVLLHIFCVAEKDCAGRTLWSYMYFIYHLAIVVWVILVLIVGYAWSTGQSAAYDE